jgi:hypothetical protein
VASADLAASFFAVAPSERRGILARIEGDAALADPPAPTDTRAVRALEDSALGGRPGDFVRELERALPVSRELAQRIVNDPTGEPVVVAARALGMPLPVLQRILLFVNPAIGHSVRRVYELSALFDDVGPSAARRLVALWRDSAPASPPPAHAPAHDRGARRVRDTAAGGERPGAVDLDEDLFLDRPQRAG